MFCRGNVSSRPVLVTGGGTYKYHLEVVPSQGGRLVAPREAVTVRDKPAHHGRQQQDPREDAENIDERDARGDLFGMFTLGRDGSDSSREWLAVAERGVFRRHGGWMWGVDVNVMVVVVL